MYYYIECLQGGPRVVRTSCSSICHCNLLVHLYNYSYRKHSQLVRVVHPMYCYKEADKCDRSITAPPLSHTARWTWDREYVCPIDDNLQL